VVTLRRRRLLPHLRLLLHKQMLFLHLRQRMRLATMSLVSRLTLATQLASTQLELAIAMVGPTSWDYLFHRLNGFASYQVPYCGQMDRPSRCRVAARPLRTSTSL